MSAIPTKARQVIAERDNRQCRRCGMKGAEIHHRMRRRDGGHQYSILILLCSDDHRWAHAHPEDAKRDGYIIPPWVDEPWTVPVKIYTGDWVLLDNAGGVNFWWPPAEAAPPAP